MNTRMAESSGGRFAVAVDCGGTFTDVVLVDRATGELWIAKRSSTPHDPSEAFIDGIQQIMELSGVGPADIGQIYHGTTVATNAILESSGAPSALLTTTGFRHVLEIGRHDIPRNSNMYTWLKPRRPVPPERIFEIAGRFDHQGVELEALDEDAVRRAAEAIGALGIRAIAICFLHSYANPRHEQRARAIIEDVDPQAMISLSSEVLPVFREYERSMATLLNVYVMPPISSYVERIETRLSSKKINSPLFLMKSSGGVTGAQTIRKEPILTALSGPAAGVAGAIYVGQQLGLGDIISIDIGGTSADVCLIRGGRAALTAEGQVGDWPLTVSMLDITSIGAGGGSIARVSQNGVLAAGPESAGASPGPVCYGQGGVHPTVTDAHCVLGRLGYRPLADNLTLDREGAARAIRRDVADPLGIPLEEAAEGILRVVNSNMVGAIRLVSIERGHDPRKFVLLPFGGAGALHTGDLARLLGIRTIVIPPSPGVLSSVGLVMTDLRREWSQTAIQRPPDYDLAEIAAVFRALENEALAWFEHEVIPEAARELRRMVSLRYEHQGFELMVGCPLGEITAELVETVIAAFHDLHLQLYTFTQVDAAVDLVTFHVEAIGRMARPGARTDREETVGREHPPRIGTQQVWFGGRHVETPFYDRRRIARGSSLEGPAVIVQVDTTVVVLPGQICHVDATGCLILKESDGESTAGEGAE